MQKLLIPIFILTLYGQCCFGMRKTSFLDLPIEVIAIIAKKSCEPSKVQETSHERSSNNTLTGSHFWSTFFSSSKNLVTSLMPFALRESKSTVPLHVQAYGAVQCTCKKFYVALQKYPLSVSEYCNLYCSSVSEKNVRNLPLIWAAKKNHAYVFKKLLCSGRYDVNQGDKNGLTSLLWATTCDHAEIFKILIEYGFVTDNQIADIFEASVSLSHENLVALLLNYESIEINKVIKGKDNTPLLYAIKNGDSEIVRLLLKHKKIKVNKKVWRSPPPLHVAIKKGNIHIVNMLLKHPKIETNKEHVDIINGNVVFNTALKEALRRKQTEIIKLLLLHKVNVTKKNRKKLIAYAIRFDNAQIMKLLKFNPLHHAIKNHDICEFKRFLHHKDFVSCFNTPDKYGNMLLTNAAGKGCLYMVKQLLRKKGVDFNDDNGCCITPLCWAIYNNQIEVVQFLLDQKEIDVNKWGDEDGRTALTLAICMQNLDMVRLLLNHAKIDVNAIDGDDDTPLECASRTGNSKIIELITQKKKKKD